MATVNGTDPPGNGPGSADIHYVHGDHLAGSNIVSDTSAAVEETTEYYPYGKVKLDTKTGSFTESKKFTGHQYDDDTGLTYAKARYYSGNTARFQSEDPMFINIGGDLKKYDRTLTDLLSNPQEMNSYSYVVNNPLKYKDPTGESLQTFGQGVMSPLTYAYNNPLQTAGIIAATAGAAAIAPVAVAVGGAALGGYAIGNAIYNAATAPDADTRDYYLGQGAIASTLTVLGIKGAGSLNGAISDDALVARGGAVTNHTPGKIDAAIGPSRMPGVSGFSVQCTNTCTNASQLGELGQHIPNNQMGVTTAGAIRQAGGDVVRTPGPGYHATVTGLNGNQASPLFQQTYRNLNPYQFNR